jgi:NADH:ubiquinone oxidoreductase subunit F (NADH-binding)/NADH:ubiquinone oxidoreductase subunit E
MSSNLIALQNKFLGRGTTVYDRLSLLHAENGFIGDDDIQALAEQYKLPPALVRSTAKFYEELRHSTPSGRVVKVCNGEACRAAPRGGCDALWARLSRGLIGAGGRPDLRLEHVACLGYCGVGPNAMVDGVPVSLAPAAAEEQLVARIVAGEPVGLPEPSNPVHLPPPGRPCVLLRHMRQDVVPLARAREAGIYGALEKALTSMTPGQVVEEIERSRLRGRGGAGFPTGTKLRTVAEAPVHDGSGRRYVVDNFDEGDAGSYIDKELVERDPHTQLEGLLLAAFACGASEAYVYVRFEYPRALAVLERAVSEAREAGLIGEDILGSGFSCEVHLVKGQGAYICGEETSLLRSLEGVPALVSYKPPFPAHQGLRGYPTAVNNVETLHNLPWIIEHGGEAYAALGYENSRGTKAVSLNTAVRRPGLYEVELGTTLREVIFDLAGGLAEGKRFKGVQVGGPLGGILPESALDTPLDFEALDRVGGILGHAGMVIYTEDHDLVEICRGLMAFCAVESCGKCFPCRIGSVRGTELFDQMLDPAQGGSPTSDWRSWGTCATP